MPEDFPSPKTASLSDQEGFANRYYVVSEDPVLNRYYMLALLLVPAIAGAHDFWVWPKTFRPAPGSRLMLEAGVGEQFPEFTNRVALERIENLKLMGRSGEQPLSSLEAPIGEAGSYVLALTVQKRFIELKPEDFTRYITGEEFKHVIEARKRAGQENKPGRESYSRCSKLLLMAGDTAGGGDVSTRAVGHELEIVPERNPARLGGPAGSRELRLPVRVLFRGKPLAGARVAAAPAGGLSQTGHDFPVVTRTDARGRAILRLTKPGPWYARMIHMIPHTEPDADWRSFFATLTFHVGK